MAPRPPVPSAPLHPSNAPLKACCLRCSKLIASHPWAQCDMKRGQKSCSYCRTKRAKCRPVPRPFRRRVQKLQKSAFAFVHMAGFSATRPKHNAAKASLVNRQQRYTAQVKEYVRKHRISDASLSRAEFEDIILVVNILKKIAEKINDVLMLQMTSKTPPIPSSAAKSVFVDALVNYQHRREARVKKDIRNDRIDDANLSIAELKATIVGIMQDLLEVLMCAVLLVCAVSRPIEEPTKEIDVDIPRMTSRASPIPNAVTKSFEMSEDESEPGSPATVKGDGDKKKDRKAKKTDVKYIERVRGKEIEFMNLTASVFMEKDFMGHEGNRENK